MGLRVGLVGCGRWGRQHLATLLALRNEGHVSFIAVCDINPNRLESLDADATYTDHDTMLDQERLDAVAIVTPPETHVRLLNAGVERGLATLVEKPFSHDHVQTVETLAQLPETSVVGVGYLLRHHTGLQRMKSTLDRDGLGKVRSVRYVRRTRREPPAGAEPIETLGVHGLDLVAWLFTRPLRSFSNVRIDRSALAATVALGDDGGASATVDVAWQAAEEVRLVEAVGDQASATLDFGTGVYTLREKSGELIERLEDSNQPLEAEWRWFFDIIRAGKPCVYPSVEALLDQSEWLHVNVAR